MRDIRLVCDYFLMNVTSITIGIFHCMQGIGESSEHIKTNAEMAFIIRKKHIHPSDAHESTDGKRGFIFSHRCK